MTDVTTPAVPRTTITAAISSALNDVLDTELPALAEDTRLFDLGLDSTSVLELLLQLEDELGREVDTEDLQMTDLQTMGSLTDYVSAQLAG
jgi:acyl carrier protein